MARLTRCILIIYTLKRILVVPVQFDEELWEYNVGKLRKFFFELWTQWCLNSSVERFLKRLLKRLSKKPLLTCFSTRMAFFNYHTILPSFHSNSKSNSLTLLRSTQENVLVYTRKFKNYFSLCVMLLTEYKVVLWKVYVIGWLCIKSHTNTVLKSVNWFTMECEQTMRNHWLRIQSHGQLMPYWHAYFIRCYKTGFRLTQLFLCLLITI